MLEEDGATAGRAIDRLEHVVRREIDVLADRLPFVTLLLRVHGNTPTERWALDRRREFDRRVAALVAEAARDGDVREDLDADVVTRLVFGMVNSLVEWFRPEGGGHVAHAGHRVLVAADLADAVVAVAFQGLRRR